MVLVVNQNCEIERKIWHGHIVLLRLIYFPPKLETVDGFPLEK